MSTILSLDVDLWEQVLWTMLYETSARAEELLELDVPELDTANRCARVTRKGGTVGVVAWQTSTARLLQRLLAGRPTGPLHQLRHSRLRHASEDCASTPMLMALSGHTSVRSLAKYARPGKNALLAWQAATEVGQLEAGCTVQAQPPGAG